MDDIFQVRTFSTEKVLIVKQCRQESRFSTVWGFFMGIGAGLLGLVFMVIIGGVIVAIVYNIMLGAMRGIEMNLEVKV